MGFGAYMKVVNSTSSQLELYISNVVCVYDNGEAGSNLSLFNDASVAANTNLPGSGTQYIECKNSGSCFFDTSSFDLKVNTSDGTTVGTISFSNSGDDWTDSTSQTDYLQVYINNSGDQATITVTVIGT